MVTKIQRQQKITEVTVLERIQKIENVGNYSRAVAGGTPLGEVSVIYGENRNGKSTLCDILYSLSLNSPQLVLDRKSIVRGQEANTINQLIELKFSGLQQAIKFRNSEWESLPPDDSVLYIFDHGFIHRNVMAGSTYSRENSTNISSFILGENLAEFEALEVRNQRLRADRRSLNALKRELEAHEVGDFEAFVALPKPTETIEELGAAIQVSKELQEGFATQIANIAQIKQRPNLSNLTGEVGIDAILADINTCLSLSMVNVHEASKAIVTAHKTKVENIGSFDGWAASGLTHLDEDCPFCGQELDVDAQQLIDSYQTAFDGEFQRFITATKEQVNQLKANVFISLEVQALVEKHHQNVAITETYFEDAVIRELNEGSLKEQLDTNLESVTELLGTLLEEANLASTATQSALSQKYDAPYSPLEPIDFSRLEARIREFNEAVIEYSRTKDSINEVLVQFKQSQNVTALQESKREESNNEARIVFSRKRLSLDVQCAQFNELKTQIEGDEVRYSADKRALEQAQEVFLDTYFDSINNLFTRIGSNDFEISRRINRGGARTVYDLEVRFKGTLIDNSKLHCLFSESDRRALALCIFLAKIQQLTQEEKAKAILVMDDPVTSFDSERISSILLILFGLEPSIKQMIVTTHYKGMASAVMKQFNDVKALKIIQTHVGSEFVSATKAEMTATAHDERYAEIMAFVERRTQDNKLDKLRLFIEDEMRQRYKLPLISLNMTERDTFNDCINALLQGDYIPDAVANSLHGYRNTLNEPAHVLALWSLEDSRQYAETMMNFIYNEL